MQVTLNTTKLAPTFTFGWGVLAYTEGSYRPFERGRKWASGFYSENAEGNFFAFWNEDCFDPAVFLVQAENFETAYEVFLEDFGKHLPELNEEEWEKENLNATWADGVVVSTECLQGEQVELSGLISLRDA